MFNHIHGHSHYSLLQAIGDLKAIAKKIKSLDQTTFPITDYNGMYGAVQQYEIAKKESLKPLIGVDICTHVVKDGKVDKACYTTLLAKNYEGYLSLLEIVSAAHTESQTTIPSFPFEKIKDKSEHIIALIGGEHSYLYRLLQQGENPKKIEELMGVYSSYFPAGQFFFEITAQLYTELPELKKLNSCILSLSKTLSLPCVVDNNFHYISPNDKDAADIATCIKDGKQYYEHGRKKKEGAWHIMSEDEIIGILEKDGYSDELVQERTKHNQELIDMINIEIPLHQLLFPVYESPEHIEKIYTQFQKLS